MESERALPFEVSAALHHLDELVQAFEEHPDEAVREHVFELLQCVDMIHRAGLRRLSDHLKLAGMDRRVLDEPEVRMLFELYDLVGDTELLELPVINTPLGPTPPPAARVSPLVSAPRVPDAAPGFVPLSAITISKRPP